MKKTGIFHFLVAVVCIAAGFAMHLLADDAGDAATIAMLTSGQWYFKGGNWSEVATFNSDHTLTEAKFRNDPNAHFTWQISGNKIILDYMNHKNVLLLPLDPKGTKGITSAGGDFVATKIDPAQLAPGGALSGWVDLPKSTVPPEVQKQADDLVKTYHNSLVIITGNGGTGSGFIALMGDSMFLVTNVHVMAAVRQPVFKNLDDVVLPAGDASVAAGADAVRMATHGGKPIEIMENVEQNAAIGDYVAVPGNSGGSGVATVIVGKITGIGPSLVQISAQIAPGDSGSPIVHLKSGKVIAVATYLTGKKFDPGAKTKLSETVDRRVGYRLDSVKAWQPVKWPDFYAQADAIGRLDGLTGDLYAFYLDLLQNTHPTPGQHNNPLLKDQIDQWTKDKRQLSVEDAQRADEMFVSFLKNVSLTDVNAMQASITYDFLQRELAETRGIRGGMAAALEKLILHTQ